MINQMSNIIASKYKQDKTQFNSLYSRIHSSILEQKIWEIIDKDGVLTDLELFNNLDLADNYLLEMDLYKIVNSIVTYLENLEITERKESNA